MQTSAQRRLCNSDNEHMNTCYQLGQNIVFTQNPCFPIEEHYNVCGKSNKRLSTVVISLNSNY